MVYEQGKRLVKKDFDLKIVTHRNFTPKKYIYDGLKVHCYDALNIGFRLGIPYPIPNVTSIGTFIDAVKSSDVIHAHGHPYLSSLASSKLAKRYGKPFVLTQHNTFIEYDGIWDLVEKLNDLAIGRQTLKAAQKIIVISNATKDYVLRLGADPEKVEVIYNGVDINRFKPISEARTEIRKKLGISEEAVVVATVRRLVYKNGVDTLLESAKLTVPKNPNLVYLVIGKGPDFNDVKNTIGQLGLEKNFLLAGFVSDEDLPRYYNAADFFVLPSKSGEGLPLVALEAMACGLPLVATKVGGIEEVMIKGYGKAIPPSNPEAMAKALVEFASLELRNLGRKLRQVMIERHSWDANVQKLANVYEEILK